MTDEVNNKELVKPKVIANLLFVGYAVLGLMVISGAVVLLFSVQCIDYCHLSIAKYRWEENPLILVLGAALIIGGWVQQQFIHGFAAGLDQLFEIRKNTSD